MTVRLEVVAPFRYEGQNYTYPVGSRLMFSEDEAVRLVEAGVARYVDELVDLVVLQSTSVGRRNFYAGTTARVRAADALGLVRSGHGMLPRSRM